MAHDSTTWNAYEATAAGILASGVNATVVVDSTFTLGLGDLIYLVADPDDPTKREWMQAEVQPGNVLMMVKRNLAGSVGDIQHGTNAKYRAVFTKQLQDDIFTDIVATEVWAQQHVGMVADPHTQYLLEDDASDTYVELAGDRMTGRLFLISSVPTDPDHASPKSYVDSQLVVGNQFTTDAIETHRLVVDAHHTRYEDSEAIAAVGTPWVGQYLPLHGTADAAAKWATGRSLKIELSGDASGSDTETVDGSTSETWTIPVVVKNDSHTHDTRYLRLTGGSLSGGLTINGGITVQNTAYLNGLVNVGSNLTVQSDTQLGFASGQVQLRNLDTGISLLIGTAAIASNKDGTVSSGASSFPWSQVYTNSLATAAREVGVDGMFDRIDELIAYVNANGGSVGSL